MNDLVNFLNIVDAILKVVSSIQDNAFTYLDRRSKKKRELADRLALHLDEISKLYRQSVKIIRSGSKKDKISKKDADKISDVCRQLHTEVRLLGNNVMSELLGDKKMADKFLREALHAADAEGVAADLWSRGQTDNFDIERYLKIVVQASGTFKALANEAKRRGSRTT